jgi:CO/xanthine dehydrogenase Mo-binding subunit
MEPRGATASYDPKADRYELRSSTQGVGPIRDSLVKIMGIKPEQVRVTADDVGGAFGIKTPVYPEYPALLVAAKKLGRPVHWMSSRAESFMSDNQARDAVTKGELALDEKAGFSRFEFDISSAWARFLPPSDRRSARSVSPAVCRACTQSLYRHAGEMRVCKHGADRPVPRRRKA